MKTKKIPEYILSAITQLQEHPHNWLSLYATGYQVLSYDDQQVIKQLEDITAYYLSSMTICQLVKIGETWRGYTSMMWSIDWRLINIQSLNNIENIIIMGGFHPSGYFREKCLKSLSNYPDTLPLLILRMNDWVKEIQELAYHLTLERLKECSFEELVQSAYILMKVRNSKRRNQVYWDDIETCFKQALNKYINYFDWQYFFKQEVSVRQAIYRLIIEYAISPSLLEKLIDKEKDTFSLSLIIKNMLINICDHEKIKSHFTHRSFYVRKEAYIRYYQLVQNTWDGIENALLDKSYSIRDYIRYIIKKHTQFDILTFYLEHLDQVEALLGVGECGNHEHINILLSKLESPDERIIKGSLKSLSNLMDYQGADIYWKFLLDNRVSLSKTAYLAIRKNKVHYGADFIYQHYLQSHQEHKKRYLLALLLEEDSWERLPYLLKLYWYPDTKIQRRIQMKVDQRNPYKKVSLELKKSIINYLNCPVFNIPKSVINSILFDLKFVCRN